MPLTCRYVKFKMEKFHENGHSRMTPHTINTVNRYMQLLCHKQQKLYQIGPCLHEQIKPPLTGRSQFIRILHIHYRYICAIKGILFAPCKRSLANRYMFRVLFYQVQKVPNLDNRVNKKYLDQKSFKLTVNSNLHSLC